MWFWRKMLQISWTDQLCNEEMLKITRERRKLHEDLQLKIKEMAYTYLKHESLLKSEGKLPRRKEEEDQEKPCWIW